MHPHRIEIFDRTDDDAVVLAVSDHFHLELFPTDQRLFDEQFVRRRSFQTALADIDEFFLIVGNASTRAPIVNEGRMIDGKPRAACTLKRFLHAVGYCRSCRTKADPGHRFLELLAIFGLVDGIFRGTDHFDAILLKNTMPGQVKGAIQRRLVQSSSAARRPGAPFMIFSTTFQLIGSI